MGKEGGGVGRRKRSGAKEGGRVSRPAARRGRRRARTAWAEGPRSGRGRLGGGGKAQGAGAHLAVSESVRGGAGESAALHQRPAPAVRPAARTHEQPRARTRS